MHKIYKLSFPYAHHENIIIVKIINAFIISQSFLCLFWIFLFYSFLQLPGNHFSATYHTHWSKFLELHANGKSILWIGFFFFLATVSYQNYFENHAFLFIEWIIIPFYNWEIFTFMDIQYYFLPIQPLESILAASNFELVQVKFLGSVRWLWGERY